MRLKKKPEFLSGYFFLQFKANALKLVQDYSETPDSNTTEGMLDLEVYKELEFEEPLTPSS